MKFKIGDIVTLIKPKKDYTSGLQWIKPMNRYVGLTTTIKYVVGNYIRLKGVEYFWSEEWIEDPILTLINEVTK